MAQKDQAQLQSDIDALMITNNTGDVTVELQKVLFNDITASVDTRGVNEITSTYTTTNSDSTVIATGTFTVNLHPLATAQRVMVIKCITGSVTVDGNGSETIEGATTHVLGAAESITIAPTSIGWEII